MKAKPMDLVIPREKVYKELGMTKQGAAEDVRAIKTWLLKQPHLPHIKAEWLSVKVDDWLENFLIQCKNSIERTKEALDLYFSRGILVPEVFTRRDPLSPPFQTSFRVIHMGLTPQVTDEGNRILIFSHTRPTADDFDPTVMMKRMGMLMDLVLLEGIVQNGIEIVVDFRHVCFGQLARYNLALTKRVYDIAMKAVPQRVKRFHFIYPTAILDAGFPILRQILSKKLQDRMVVHREVNDLIKLVGPQAIPADIGGEAPTISELNRMWEEKMIEYRDWFMSSESVKSDESKRVGKCRYETADTFGHQGSFRKIEVD